MSDKNWFNISDFNISGQPIPEDVADKILEYHLIPGNRVRNKLGFAIWPSVKSSYRPRKWELSKGREGNSQHTFKAEGATDWTCLDFDNNLDLFLKTLIKETSYRRFAVYDTFIHCDYAGLDRWVFNSKWERLYKI